jgi:hypothetical protein
MALSHVCLLAFFLFFLFGLCTPSVQSARAASRRAVCLNHLKQIVLALHNYHDEYGSFSPAYVADDNGRPMHSWRVLILPYLDAHRLYREYRFDEPWDSEANRTLIKWMPSVYACPTHYHSMKDTTNTSYVAIVDPQTCWPLSDGRQSSEILDGVSQTVMVIECDSEDIPWTEPRDLDLQTAIRVLNSIDAKSSGTHRSKTFFYEYHEGRSVAWADGRARFFPMGISQSDAESLFVIDDGWPESDSKLTPPTPYPSKQLRIGNAIRFAIFFLLAILPLPWVWVNPQTLERPLQIAT